MPLRSHPRGGVVVPGMNCSRDGSGCRQNEIRPAPLIQSVLGRFTNEPAAPSSATDFVYLGHQFFVQIYVYSHVPTLAHSSGAALMFWASGTSRSLPPQTGTYGVITFGRIRYGMGQHMFKLRNMFRSRWGRRVSAGLWGTGAGMCLALALGGSAAAGAFGGLDHHSGNSPTSSGQPGSPIILSQRLERHSLAEFANGVALSVPTAAEATVTTVTQAQAEAAATSAFPADNGRTSSYAVEAALADVSAPGDYTLDGNTFWVVSVGPQGHFPAPPSGATGKWELVFVDPRSGKWVTSIGG